MLWRRTPRLARRHGGAPGIRGAALVLCALVALADCQFVALRENLRVLDRNGYLRGTVAPPAAGSAVPLVVFAVPIGGGPAADWVVLPRPGPYFLIVPVGRYRVGVFADQNHSLVHEAGEAVGWLHGGEPVEVPPGGILSGLDLALGPDATAEPIAAGLLPVRSSGEVDELPASGIGEVVTFDDSRFSDAAAREGLWRPAQFLVDVGAGIYFLEPYDPARTPVVFVHGAVGHPGNFQVLVSRLDRRRYQAWLAYYPSAVRLEVAAAALGRWLQALEVEYGFHRLGVVAHSMGGLVVRAYLADDPDGPGATIDSLTFVSIATPWQGHARAALGVRQAPVVVPSWFDMAPGSPFLTWVLDAPLPRYASHDLYFAYGGSYRSRIANDGVVTVASQLDPRAQRQARLMAGFDAQHRAVLDDPAVGDALQRSLARIEPP